MNANTPVAAVTDKVTVRRSNGASFTGNKSWTGNSYYGTRGTFFADVNNDRSADAIVVNNDKVTVRPSIAGVFVSMESAMLNLGNSKGVKIADT